MKRSVPALIVALSLAISAQPAHSAAASLQSGDSSSDGATTVANPNQVVCRQVANTGWRLGASRVCKTRAEWAALSRRQTRDLENYNSYQGRSRCLGCDN